VLSSELADRYGEAQRDIKRKVDEISSLNVALQSLKQEERLKEDSLLLCQSELQGMKEEREHLQRVMVHKDQAIAQGQGIISKLKEEVERLSPLEQLVTSLREEREQEGERVVSLQRQCQDLAKAVDAAQNSAQNLEEYKARAQKAIKQV
jgi:chromosome segregation ATPase